MKLLKPILAVFLGFIFAFSTIACSKGKSPVEPVMDNTIENIQEIPISFNEEDSNRSMLAAYNCVIDPIAQTFTVEPMDRSADYHFPLTQLYPDVLQITNINWAPDFWVEIKLSHPLPGSGIDAFDPRVIAILPAYPGVSMDYPIFNVHANNYIILEPDGYTKLFDSLNPSIVGNTNPFMAYFKDEPNRVWSSTGMTEETRRWYMNITGIGGPFVYELVVDVSTNYPLSPLPVRDNAPEPVEIDAEIGYGLTNQGGSTSIEVRLKHWKDISEVGGVLVECPDLLTDTISLQYDSYSPIYGASIFIGSLVNENNAEHGLHNLLIQSWDNTSGIQLFNEFSVDVGYLSENCNLIWAKRAGSGGNECGYAVTALSDNSTVVTGYFRSPATFGEGEPNETVLYTAGYYDIFIARYNPDGTLQWAKSAGGASFDYCHALTTLSDDSFVITGRINESATFGKGEPNETVLHSAGYDDVFIARYDPDGTLQWAKRAGGVDRDGGYAITTLSDDSSVVTGYFEDTAIFGDGEPNETIMYSKGECDIFIARYNPNGTLQWAKHAGGAGYDIGYATTTLSDDSTVVTGNFSDSAIFGEGESNETVMYSNGANDIFIARYNPDGTLQWAKRADGESSDGGNSVTALSDDSTVVTGYYWYSATFGEGEPNETTLPSFGSPDMFIARYNPDGALQWAKRAGGVSMDCGRSVTALSDDSTVVTGYFSSSTRFGVGEINEIVLNSAGDKDIFIARYNPDGTLKAAKCAGGSEDEEGYSLTTLSDDSTVLTGYFMNRALFGKGEPNETYLNAEGDDDIFIARFGP